MPTVHVEAQLSTADLLDAAGQLTGNELDDLVQGLIALRARRMAPQVSADEANLLLKVAETLPDHLRRRYRALADKRDSRTLSPGEHQELLDLTDEVEGRQAERVEALGELARLRGKTLDELMRDLGVGAQQDA